MPSGGHPRLFMSADEITAFKATAKQSGSAAKGFVDRCQETLDHPEYYTERGGVDGDTWPGAAMACAFSYTVTQNAQHLTQAIKYWHAALEDDQALGDKLACVAGVSTGWQSWAESGNGDTPAILKTITHDTGYPIRWYGPDIALTYDWLYSAPGVDAGLLAQTRTCLTNWLDWYSQYGYHHDQPGANYGAGFVIAKTFGAIALGNDAGGDGHHWTEVVDKVFGQELVGDGLKGQSGKLGDPVGVLVGGDWPEGWQYGPLSISEYAVAARALEQYGAPQPEMDAWTNSLALRAIYATVPAGDGMWVGGDFDSDEVYRDPVGYAAVMAGPSSDEIAGYAAFEAQKLGGFGSFFYDALAEIRQATPMDFRAQSTSPPLWYLSRGTRTLYARTSWDPSAFYGVFESSPETVDDHHHFSSSNFAFSRGADHLIVDPSYYGCRSTLPTNALTADSDVVMGDYKPSQTPWSEADLPWARASDSALYAARSDFAKAFNYASSDSDIPYAHREWVFLPEGEMVTIDRVRTGAANKFMYVNFHANTAGSLMLNGGVATGTVGGSKLVIHGIYLSGAFPSLSKPPIEDGNCYDGTCINVRFPVDEYSVKVPGPFAVAIHAIDGLGASEDPAQIGSLNDDNFDPEPKQNTGVIGAAVYRSMKQSYVVASSAQDGASGASMSYGIPAADPARHVVFDAPEASDGSSSVAAVAQGGRCVLTITPGSGGGITGHPLMFQTDSATNGCTVTASTDVGSAQPPPGGGVDPIGQNPNTGGTGAAAKDKSGCGCRVASANGPRELAWLGLLAASVLTVRIRSARARRTARHG